MHSLYLLRHAKSSWSDPTLDDINRPLNKRGKSDALLMAQILRDKNEIPELIITSPAKRARSTAKRFSEIFGRESVKSTVNEKLYMAYETDFFNVIWNVAAGVKRLMLVSHNPGITDFANVLTGSGISNFPTCGIIKIDFDINSWHDVTKQNGVFRFFEFPKMYKLQDGK